MTSCGNFAHGGVTIHYGSVEVDNLGQINGMYLCGGDSGGPIFRRNEGYGIVEGGNIADLGYAIDTGIGVVEAKCGSTTFYQGMGEAQALTNTYLVTANPG